MVSVLVVTASSLTCMQLPLHFQAATVYQAAAQVGALTVLLIACRLGIGGDHAGTLQHSRMLLFQTAATASALLAGCV